MFRLIFNKIAYLLIFSLSTSCVSNRNLIYFNNLTGTNDYTEEIANNHEPVIQDGDLLSITINSPNPESNLLYNSSILLPANNASLKENGGYLVDKEGFIKFPVLGNIKLSGLTRSDAVKLMTARMEETLKKPIVTISYLNFRVTVLGEVNNPSSLLVPSEHINLLEALGLAGDMTAYGQREDVMIIREKNGVRTVAQLNLNKKEVFKSPYFYLQQNDVVYVKPNKARSLQASSRAVNLPVYISVASVLAILISSLIYQR